MLPCPPAPALSARFTLATPTVGSVNAPETAIKSLLGELLLPSVNASAPPSLTIRELALAMATSPGPKVP